MAEQGRDARDRMEERTEERERRDETREQPLPQRDASRNPGGIDPKRAEPGPASGDWSEAQR